MIRRPKKTPLSMVFLRKYPERIDAVYKEEVGSSSLSGIALRNDIARRLFDQEPEEEKKACEDTSLAELAEKQSRYEATCLGDISKNPEDMAE